MEDNAQLPPEAHAPGALPPKQHRMTKARLATLGIGAGAGLVIGGLIGGFIGAAPVGDLEQQVSTQQASMETLTAQNETLEAGAEGYAAAIKEQEDLATAASVNAETTIADFKDSQKSSQAKLKDRESAVSAAEKQLAKDQKKFDGAVADREKNTVGPGLYEVGVDVKAGKYKTSGPDGTNPVGCYYAWMSSSEADADIVDNNIVSGQAVVTLRNGQFFEIDSCADFVKQ
ncbi:MAG: hypothetical protein L0H86_11410 [Micrococcaceae bacterium]|nr:hypothetical protein [Micrococcaceae bacterium]MDN6170470.1 hypothetical protein [Micrococcaceae bacterium]